MTIVGRQQPRIQVTGPIPGLGHANIGVGRRGSDRDRRVADAPISILGRHNQRVHTGIDNDRLVVVVVVAEQLPLEAAVKQLIDVELDRDHRRPTPDITPKPGVTIRRAEALSRLRDDHHRAAHDRRRIDKRKTIAVRQGHVATTENQTALDQWRGRVKHA